MSSEFNYKNLHQLAEYPNHQCHHTSIDVLFGRLNIHVFANVQRNGVSYQVIARSQVSCGYSLFVDLFYHSWKIQSPDAAQVLGDIRDPARLP